MSLERALARALHNEAGRAETGLDPQQVVGKARRRHRTRMAAASTGAAAVIAAALVVPSLVLGGAAERGGPNLADLPPAASPTLPGEPTSPGGPTLPGEPTPPGEPAQPAEENADRAEAPSTGQPVDDQPQPTEAGASPQTGPDTRDRPAGQNEPGPGYGLYSTGEPATGGPNGQDEPKPCGSVPLDDGVRVTNIVATGVGCQTASGAARAVSGHVGQVYAFTSGANEFSCETPDGSFPVSYSCTEQQIGATVTFTVVGSGGSDAEQPDHADSDDADPEGDGGTRDSQRPTTSPGT